MRASPSLDTSPEPVPATVRAVLVGGADPLAGGSLAMACVTISPPQSSPPTAASRVTRRTTRRRACLIPWLPNTEWHGVNHRQDPRR
ncbi:hypothetical protein GCM10023083_77500 [Streptomyces phyllanthi]